MSFDYSLFDAVGMKNGEVSVERADTKPDIILVRITSRSKESRLQEALDKFPVIYGIVYHKEKLFSYIVDGVAEKKPLYKNDLDKMFRFLTLQDLYEVKIPRVVVHLDDTDTSEFTNAEFQYSLEFYEVEDKTEYKEYSYKVIWGYPEVTPEGKIEVNANSTVDDRERRKKLKCSICPPNKGDNAKKKSKRGKGKPKSKFKRKGK